MCISFLSWDIWATLESKTRWALNNNDDDDDYDDDDDDNKSNI